MTRDQQELYRLAENSYVRMQRRYAQCRALLNERGSAVSMDRESRSLGFDSMSEMQMWVLDIEMSVSRVAKAIGFNAWSITGDRFVVGLTWRRIAESHRISAENCKHWTREWVGAMFVDHLERGIPDDYGFDRIAA